MQTIPTSDTTHVFQARQTIVTHQEVVFCLFSLASPFTSHAVNNKGGLTLLVAEEEAPKYCY